MGDDDLAGEAAEIGNGAAAQHGQHLKGRARQHEHMDAAAFKGAAGGRAHGIVEHGAARRQLRLLDIVFRHDHVDVVFKKRPNGVQNVRVKHQGLVKGGADGLLRQVVVGGAQAAGGDDDIRPPAGDVQGLTQPLRVIPHHRVPKDVDAYGGQGLGDVPGIGVDDVAEEQLRAHGDDLSGV